ncbi:MAG: hypothetical protein V4550_12165 [Gemmatimonadota bacterium]
MRVPGGGVRSSIVPRRDHRSQSLRRDAKNHNGGDLWPDPSFAGVLLIPLDETVHRRVRTGRRGVGAEDLKVDVEEIVAGIAAEVIKTAGLVVYCDRASD